MSKPKTPFIAIEGPDGVGKSTQIRLLSEHFQNKGVATRFIHFPRLNQGLFGAMIAKFLRGEFGAVESVHPQLVALLFSEDRKEFAPTITTWLQQGDCVLVDRYVYSNIAYQCAKIYEPTAKLALKNWILELEYGFNKIPKPDLTFYLDVPSKFTADSLRSKREGLDRIYLQGKDDIHEKDLNLQAAVRMEYENLVQTQTGFIRIVCYNGDGSMKTVEEIHQRILEQIDAFAK